MSKENFIVYLVDREGKTKYVERVTSKYDNHGCEVTYHFTDEVAQAKNFSERAAQFISEDSYAHFKYKVACAAER